MKLSTKVLIGVLFVIGLTYFAVSRAEAHEDNSKVTPLPVRHPDPVIVVHNDHALEGAVLGAGITWLALWLIHRHHEEPKPLACPTADAESLRRQLASCVQK